MESDLQPREVVVLHLSQQVAALLQRKVKDVPALGECWRSSSDCEDQALCGSLTSLTQVAREIKRLAGERAKDKDICLLASATDVAILGPVLVDEDINGHSCRNCRDGHILPEIATPGPIWIGEASPALTPSTSGADTLRDSEEMHK
ncbi:DIS3-like exonuclease 2 [Dissostichus eleginoides]|uniref:DIS3-like exonuclease 2 n=1 Tax=Dissostichus eleginoides TaxID=100907 RepID=A0AAD9FF73_DISEL|nr:DIS3-like exonuclease 2 [Dissostichus eleginoides]